MTNGFEIIEKNKKKSAKSPQLGARRNDSKGNANKHNKTKIKKYKTKNITKTKRMREKQ